MVKTFDDMFSRFGTIHECERQIDGQKEERLAVACKVIEIRQTNRREVEPASLK